MATRRQLESRIELRRFIVEDERAVPITGRGCDLGLCRDDLANARACRAECLASDPFRVFEIATRAFDIAGLELCLCAIE